MPAAERAATLGKRKREAEAMRERFTSCETTRQFAKGLIDVTVRDLGRVLAPQLPPDWADKIKTTKPGTATNVRETERGVEFIGVCSSREVSDDRVAQMVFPERRRGRQEGRRAQQEVRRRAAGKGAHRRALNHRIVPHRMSLPLALTAGDPSGVGPEIAIKAWLSRDALSMPALLCHRRSGADCSARADDRTDAADR